MIDVATINDPAAAAAALEPVKCRLLAELAEPASAAALAKRLGMPRQKLNYHLRLLQTHGLVQPAGERQWGGLTERLLVASAGSYVVAPGALGPVATDPARSRDRLSAGYLIALAARAVQEVGGLLQRATEAGRRLSTLSVDTEIRFRSPADRAAFSRELSESVAALAARYHDPGAPNGRVHRLVTLVHPLPSAPQTPTDEASHGC